MAETNRPKPVIIHGYAQITNSLANECDANSSRPVDSDPNMEHTASRQAVDSTCCYAIGNK